METSQSAEGNSASTAEVSWQTCFWILVTLGLNAMAQPCGCIFGRKSLYSTYLRSSPFICIVDAVYTFVQFGYAALRSGVPIRTCSRSILEDRFRSVQEIKNVKNTAWLRWLFFVLGPLPQAVRLAFFRGTPWTQIFGFCYLSSWLLMEILLLISEAERVREHTTLWKLDPDVSKHLDDIVLNLCLNFNFYAWLIPFAKLSVLIAGSFEESITWLWLVLFLLLLLGLFAFYFGFAFGMVFFVRWVCRRNPGLGQNLLLAFCGREPETVTLDEGAIVNLVIFVTNFLVCLTAYRFVYESTGTSNPGWTVVFG